MHTYFKVFKGMKSLALVITLAYFLFKILDIPLVTSLADLFFKGNIHLYLVNVSIIIKMNLKPLFFLECNYISIESACQRSSINCVITFRLGKVLLAD